MPCDLLTDVDLDDVIDYHILNDSSLTMVLKKDEVEVNKKGGSKPTNVSTLSDY